METTLKEKQLAFHITTACTLNCKQCVSLVPHFKGKGIVGHISLEQIRQEIAAVFQIYDHIEDVTISGGEPLLHPNLSEIVSYCMSFEKQFVVIPLSQPEKVPAYGTLRQIQLSHDTENRGKGSWQR